jgi:cell division protein ZapA
MDDKLSIKINIGDRYYPMRIERNEEEKYRRAASMLNDKITKYKHSFADKDQYDFLAMTALQMAVHAVQSSESNDIGKLKSEIDLLNEEIEKYIRESN